MKPDPALILFPLPVSETTNHSWLGDEYKEVLLDTRLFFVENVRTARRFISSLKLGIDIDALRFEVLDKDTDFNAIRKYADLIKQFGSSIIMSEAGCPAVADPGSLLVDEAHKCGIIVRPFVGPSAILLSLMGSGLSGQNFSFNCYLPIEKGDRNARIIQLEKESKNNHRTQIFIETPYRNSSLWHTFLEVLNAETRLCIALDVLGKNQIISQRKVKEWNFQQEVSWPKQPAVFLFLA